MEQIVLNGKDIKLSEFTNLIKGAPFLIDEGLKKKIESSEALLKSCLEAGKTIYGVNTGYGYNCTNVISPKDMVKLQSNLVTYLRCGTGKNLSYKESKAVGIARFISISKGLSGISLEFVNRYKDLLKLNYVPVIPSNGSLGASGDLIPLAYWAEFLQGAGQALDPSGKVHDVETVFKENGFGPYEFKPKEGLSVVNGTSAMAGVAYTNFIQTKKLVYLSGVLTSWGLISLQGWGEAFSPLVNKKAKDFTGQAKFASFVSATLKDESYDTGRSFDVQKVGEQTDRALQDRYSIRCAPQIMGPFLDTMSLGETWIEKEINGVSDNPIFDAEAEEVAMGGNFYGGYISQLMDYLKISLVQMADMTDRQLLLVMDGYTNNGLPTNLVNPALEGFDKNMNHGLKGLHQSASAITSEIAALCMPNSIFSRSSETHNQDKVSLGFSACKQYGQMIELSFELTALSMVCLAQALDIRKVKLNGKTLEVYDLVRKHIPFVEKDRALTLELSNLIKELKDIEFGGMNELF